MPEASLDELRRRLVEIDDEIRALPADAFAAKYELSTEADRLRRDLADHPESASDDTSKKWAERSGRKGSHAVDEDLARAKAAIPSPLHTN